MLPPSTTPCPGRLGGEGAQNRQHSSTSLMRFNVRIGGIHGLPDPVQIWLPVSGTRYCNLGHGERPRATSMPYPFQIIQNLHSMMIAYEYASGYRNIFLKDPGEARWDGDTFVVDVTGQNDQSWFDRSGNFHSDQLHVVEWYTLVKPDVINYEATIEDPAVFSRAWNISTPLYRHLEGNARLGEFKCVEFAEEIMYGKYRKKTN